MISGDTYTCGNCHGTFETDWTDEDAATEYAQEFPGEPISDGVVVCDDCYKTMTSVIPTPGAIARAAWFKDAFGK